MEALLKVKHSQFLAVILVLKILLNLGIGKIAETCSMGGARVVQMDRRAGADVERDEGR